MSLMLLCVVVCVGVQSHQLHYLHKFMIELLKGNTRGGQVLRKTSGRSRGALDLRNNEYRHAYLVLIIYLCACLFVYFNNLDTKHVTVIPKVQWQYHGTATLINISVVYSMITVMWYSHGASKNSMLFPWLIFKRNMAGPWYFCTFCGIFAC